MKLLITVADFIILSLAGGGAHPVSPIDISSGFIGYIPFARAISPVTKTNWEAKGVQPDITTNTFNALEIAKQGFYQQQISLSKD